MIIWTREKREVNTDPQRRCYNGCHAKSEMRWQPWKALGYPATREQGEARILGWKQWDKYISQVNKTNVEREYALTDGCVPI